MTVLWVYCVGMKPATEANLACPMAIPVGVGAVSNDDSFSHLPGKKPQVHGRRCYQNC